jgi:(4S)-4-hydroxy-5-phosphonooxypentane-2,3-dione isomerase
VTARGGGYVVIVNFQVKPEFRAAFRDAVLENASASRMREPGCSVFDVCENQDGSEFFLYEVYDSEARFRDHLATEHFRHFDSLVAPWVVDKRVVTYRRLN